MPSVHRRYWLGGRKGIRPVKKTEWRCAGVVVCLERGADLHMVQLMPLPLTVSCFSKIQIGFTFLVTAYQGSPGKGPLNGCVCQLPMQYTGRKTIVASKSWAELFPGHKNAGEKAKSKLHVLDLSVHRSSTIGTFPVIKLSSV